MRMLSLAEWIINKYNTARKKSDDLWKQIRHKEIYSKLFNDILKYSEEAVLYIFLAYQVIFLKMSYANFTMFFSAIKNFSLTISKLIGTVMDIGEDSVYIESFKKYMELENTIAIEKENELHITLYEMENLPIYLQNVSFKYLGTEKFILKNINITLEPKKFYVVVGVNGAGKTTLINLLCRLYDVSDGKILLGNTNIKEFNYKEYRKLFGVVFQNYKIYNYSIAENIAMNDYDETEKISEKIYECIVKAGLENKVNSLKDGINTYIGRSLSEDGVNLSGGEIQKIALAKAL